jgi:hypothetical protein
MGFHPRGSKVVRMGNLGESNDGWEDLFVFRPGLFFLDELIDQLGHGAAGNASGRLRLGAVGVSHVPQIERLLGADVVVIVKSELATLTALKIFRHGEFLR